MLRSLAYEQQFAVFGQGPETVFDNHLQMVCLMTDGLHLGFHGVVIGDGAGVNIVDAVGDAAGIGQFLHIPLDTFRALGYLLDEFHVSHAEPFRLLLREDGLHHLHILDELALVVGGDGDDMVHRGFEIFTQMILRYHPRYHLYGHIHAEYGKDFVRRQTFMHTEVINCYEKYLFDYDTGEDIFAREYCPENL